MSRWAVIGSSGFAEQTCIPTLLKAPSSDLLGCCGSDPSGSRRVAQRYSLAKAYADVADVAADPDVEVVWIASPTGFHAEQAETLMAAGKSVLIDKPVALTLGQAEGIKRTAERNAVTTAVGFHQRFKTAHVRARQEVENGTIGKTAHIHCKFLTSYAADPAEWRRRKATSGGGWSINDIGTHLIDTVRFIAQSDIVAAKALFGTVRFDYETDDIFAGVLKLRSGVLASVEASTAVEGPATRLEIIGTLGSIVIEGSFKQRSTMIINAAEQEVMDENGAYVEQVRAFEALLKGQASSIATLDDGISNLQWVTEMIKS